MKKLLLAAMAFAACATAAWGQMAASDSVKVLRNVDNVVVTDGDRGLKVMVGDSANTRYTYSVRPDSIDNGWDLDLPFLKKKQQRTSVLVLNDIFVGLSFPRATGLQDCGFEIGVNNVVGLRWRNASWSSLSIGAGLRYAVYCADEGWHFAKIDGRLLMLQNPAEAEKVKSRLDLARLVVPVVWKLYPSDKFEFRLGAIASLDVGSRAQTSYCAEGYKYTEHYCHLPTNAFTADLFLGLGFSDAIGIYAKYMPMHAFRKGCGPDLAKFSAGISLCF